MTGTLARRAFQVAGLAAGIVLFGAGVAQAASPAQTEADINYRSSSDTDIDQDATNVCGNNAGNGGVAFNLTGCGAANIAASDSDWGDDLNWRSSNDTDVNQDATNVCGNNLANGGVFANAALCGAGNVAVDG